MQYIIQVHFPEDGHYSWLKHVGSYPIDNTINLHICICIWWYIS